MIHFCSITVHEKSKGEDYRAFLLWADSELMIQYEIRGYGDTPGRAADDAYAKYEEGREFYTSAQWEWK